MGFLSVNFQRIYMHTQPLPSHGTHSSPSISISTDQAPTTNVSQASPTTGTPTSPPKPAPLSYAQVTKMNGLGEMQWFYGGGGCGLNLWCVAWGGMRWYCGGGGCGNLWCTAPFRGLTLLCAAWFCGKASLFPHLSFGYCGDDVWENSCSQMQYSHVSFPPVGMGSLTSEKLAWKFATWTLFLFFPKFIF